MSLVCNTAARLAMFPLLLGFAGYSIAADAEMPLIPEANQKDFAPMKMELAYDPFLLRFDLCAGSEQRYSMRYVNKPSNYWPTGKGAWAKPVPQQAVGVVTGAPAVQHFMGIDLGNGLFIDYNRNIALNVLTWLGIEKNDPLSIRAEHAQGGFVSYERQGGQVVCESGYKNKRMPGHIAEIGKDGALVNKGKERIAITAGPDVISAKTTKNDSDKGKIESISLAANHAVIKTPKKDFDVILDTAAKTVKIADTHEIIHRGKTIEIYKLDEKGKKTLVVSVLQDEHQIVVDYADKSKSNLIITKGDGSFTVAANVGSKSVSVTYNIGAAAP